MPKSIPVIVQGSEGLYRVMIGNEVIELEGKMKEEEFLVDFTVDYSIPVFVFECDGKHRLMIRKDYNGACFDFKSFMNMYELLNREYKQRKLNIVLDLNPVTANKKYKQKMVMGRSFANDTIVFYTYRKNMDEREVLNFKHVSLDAILYCVVGKGMRMKAFRSKWNMMAEAMIHELGHIIYYNLPVYYKNVWRDIWVGCNDKKFSTLYSTKSLQEYFAESFVSFCLFEDKDFYEIVGKTVFDYFKTYVRDYRISFKHEGVMNIEPSTIGYGKKVKYYGDEGKLKMYEEEARKIYNSVVVRKSE